MKQQYEIDEAWIKAACIMITPYKATASFAHRPMPIFTFPFRWSDGMKRGETRKSGKRKENAMETLNSCVNSTEKSGLSSWLVVGRCDLNVAHNYEYSRIITCPSIRHNLPHIEYTTSFNETTSTHNILAHSLDRLSLSLFLLHSTPIHSNSCAFCCCVGDATQINSLVRYIFIALHLANAKCLDRNKLSLKWCHQL